MTPRSVISMSDIIIRKAIAEDADVLSVIEHECFTDPWETPYFQGLLANPAVYFAIAEKDGVPVAFGGMTVVVDECDIINVAVSKAVRRLGIGRAMVAHLLEICKDHGVTSAFLEHRQSNTAAAALYESFGFEPYATRKKYYSSPTEDAILRKLTL